MPGKEKAVIKSPTSLADIFSSLTILGKAHNIGKSYPKYNL
jgi:hypothetical protein